MTENVFYSDRERQGKPRVSETISTEVWVGLTILIRQWIDDGSLARAFPRYGCQDDPGRLARTRSCSSVPSMPMSLG